MTDHELAAVYIEPEVFVTIEDAAYLTGHPMRSIRRYIQTGAVRSITDPTDARRKLIPEEELLTIVKKAQHGLRRQRITLVRQSDGLKIVKLVARPVKG